MTLGVALMLCCCRTHDGRPSSLSAEVPLRRALEVAFSSVSSGTKGRKKKKEIRELPTAELPSLQGMLYFWSQCSAHQPPLPQASRRCMFNTLKRNHHTHHSQKHGDSRALALTSQQAEVAGGWVLVPQG